MSDKKKDATLEEITAALEKYENNSVSLLQRAYDEGGVPSVKALQDEYAALQSAYYDLLKRELISNTAKYASLMDETIAATKAIQSSIDSLEKISKVLSAMAKTVDLVGRALVLFGV
jgi:hypothetical protein